jgi:AraC-like DNA-binding protein
MEKTEDASMSHGCSVRLQMCSISDSEYQDDIFSLLNEEILRLTPKVIVKSDFSLPAEFPFAVMRAQGQQQTPQVVHWHDCLEINWVEGGRGVNYIADREYRLQPGQLFLINNIDRHIAVSDGSLDMRIVIFEPSLFWKTAPEQQEYLRMFYPVGEQIGNLAQLSDENLARAHTLILEMEAEWSEKKRGYEMMLRAKLMELLAILYRATPETMEAKEAAALRKGYQRIRPAINYIQSHFAGQLSLETLASLSGMSRTYFCTLFKKTMGLTYGAYVEKIRVNRACMLLATSDLPVLDIALESGFTSLSNFNATFKAACGKTPSQYRRDLPL